MRLSVPEIKVNILRRDVQFAFLNASLWALKWYEFKYVHVSSYEEGSVEISRAPNPFNLESDFLSPNIHYDRYHAPGLSGWCRRTIVKNL